MILITLLVLVQSSETVIVVDHPFRPPIHKTTHEFTCERGTMRIEISNSIREPSKLVDISGDAARFISADARAELASEIGKLTALTIAPQCSSSGVSLTLDGLAARPDDEFRPYRRTFHFGYDGSGS